MTTKIFLDFFRQVKPIFDLAGIECDVKVTERPNQARDLLLTYDFERPSARIDGIVSVGGDGMFSELINGILRRAAIDSDGGRALLLDSSYREVQAVYLDWIDNAFGHFISYLQNRPFRGIWSKLRCLGVNEDDGISIYTVFASSESEAPRSAAFSSPIPKTPEVAAAGARSHDPSE